MVPKIDYIHNKNFQILKIDLYISIFNIIKFKVKICCNQPSSDPENESQTPKAELHLFPKSSLIAILK